MRAQFEEIYRETIHREGADRLLDWLGDTDFFTAPASTRYHGAHEGGLVEHSVNVYRRLTNSPAVEYATRESIAICGLLHDVCKAGFYTVSLRNVKNEETGRWEKQPYYTVEDKFPYGHGEKSVYLIERYLRLRPEEAAAINWHMGGFDDRVKGGSFALSGAFGQYPLALELHIADLRATYLDEERKQR